MIQDQTFEAIAPGDVPEMAEKMKEDGFRLVQICAVASEEKTEILYSFDKDFILRNIRTLIQDGKSVKSITPWFWSAFIYENEIHDLFGVPFEDSQLDYRGNFFRMSSKTPWKKNPVKVEEARRWARGRLYHLALNIPHFPNPSIWTWNWRTKPL